jgi:(1->4)-alpha-D-glucan 1-alpha-D-glucosylmutase
VTPRATYRLQLTPDFSFDRAAEILDYLQGIGVSHVYCSPVLQATAGSTHGYDVVDPTRISDELGGEPAFMRLVDAARRHGLGLIVDIVPNHMATAGRANPWWWDVLSRGRESRYSGFFDIDWNPSTSPLQDRVLLAVLGDRYGKELESGAIEVDHQGPEPVIRYHDQVFPIAPESRDSAQLDRAARDPDALDSLLERQHYRLAYWRSAQEEINYRRFFTIDSLIGLRVEDPEVFAESHGRIAGMLGDHTIDGVRVDHVDGLRDPAAYLEHLRHAAGAYIVVEKILGPDEELPESFPVQGTTGYDFISAADNLFVDTRSEAAMTGLYHAFTGEAATWEDMALAAKRELIGSELAPDLARLTALMVEICEADRRHRDRTHREIQDAVTEVAAGFRVYRTYVRPDAPATPEDRAEVGHAVAAAGRHRPEIEAGLLALIGEVLLLERRDAPEQEFTARFQQFTPAVMAKGVEDTAFYRYHRLVALNEVGGDPGTFGRPQESFHAWCARIARTRPETMLTLSTHDTKRSGDVRARLDVLSEIPAAWDAAVRAWAEHNSRYRASGYPDRNLEYLAYQTLVGAWPIDATRLAEFLRKAAREAKVHTSWASPVAAYEEALVGFVDAILSDAEFTTQVEAFLGSTRLVALGRLVALAQTALLLTCPGVPDLYQGTEAWDLSLVDPDNRRPVDFASRRALWREASTLAPADAAKLDDGGAVKVWMIGRLLRARRERPAVFASTEYTPLHARGGKAEHAVAFSRGSLLALVPRLPASLGGEWGDTEVDLPAGSWTDLLTGEVVEGGRAVAVSELVQGFPVTVLARDG